MLEEPPKVDLESVINPKADSMLMSEVRVRYRSNLGAVLVIGGSDARLNFKEIAEFRHNYLLIFMEKPRESW